MNPGTLIEGRYLVVGVSGRGVFSTVVMAKDLKTPLSSPEDAAAAAADGKKKKRKGPLSAQALLAQKGGAESNAVEDPSKEYKLVAIKVIRNNDTLRKLAVKEVRHTS